MSKVVKISVSFSEDDYRYLKKRAKKLGSSVSAVLADSVATERRLAAMTRYLDKSGGDDFADEEIEAVRREWRG